MADLQLGEDVLHVDLDRVLGDAQLRGDLAVERLAHREPQLGFISGLEHIADGARADRLEQQVGVFDHAQDQDAAHQPVALQSPCGLQAIHARHAQVHQDQVGLECPSQVHGFTTVACFAHHLEVGFLAEDQPQPGARQPVVVGNQYAPPHSPGRCPSPR